MVACLSGGRLEGWLGRSSAMGAGGTAIQ